ncbi:radical SAM protein [Patescibacteria group bacterium]|nr:radical SAM protein [Patescibacteria group bacterium]
MLFKIFSFFKILPLSYTFSLTNKCNSRCLTCNIWQKKATVELTKEEWKRIFQSLGHSPYWVTLSGGEPFLRADLMEIVSDLCRIGNPKIINIPSNGLLTEKIVNDVGKITKANPKTNFVINLSLDGIREKHDQARGIKGNFDKTVKTLSLLKKLKKRNLTIGIHTVISKNNAKEFPRIADYVLDTLKPDSYITEIAENRVELDNLSNKIQPSLEDYKTAINYLKTRMKKEKSAILPRIQRAFRFVYYDLVIKILKEQKQVIPCYAGLASAQIAANGDIWPCCVRADILGNLKENNYDFKKIWFSPKADLVRKSIKERKCFCPLANASYTNILLNPVSLGQALTHIF